MPSRDFKRTDRVSAELRREIGLLVHAAVRDHALPSVSVSDVEVSRELDWATVWVTALIPGQSATAVKGLKELRGEFRHALSQRMRLRRVPELRFKYDDSVDKGERIESLLRDSGDVAPLDEVSPLTNVPSPDDDEG
ncbi:MAG TPA: 30S ribosome-binding factor RbfA [Luteibacter sp.]|jgi:ribosome-binding factor A|nr:30S ribosome-binding factor RbfA [Luteibacter sp.]